MSTKKLGPIATAAAGVTLTFTGLVGGAKADVKTSAPNPTSPSTPDCMAEAPAKGNREKVLLDALGNAGFHGKSSLERVGDEAVSRSISHLKNAGLALENDDFKSAAKHFESVYAETAIKEFQVLADRTKDGTVVKEDVLKALDRLKEFNGEIEDARQRDVLLACLASLTGTVLGTFGGIGVVWGVTELKKKLKREDESDYQVY